MGRSNIDFPAGKRRFLVGGQNESDGWVRRPGEGLLLIRNSDPIFMPARGRGGAFQPHPPSPTLMARGPMEFQPSKENEGV